MIAPLLVLILAQLWPFPGPVRHAGGAPAGPAFVAAIGKKGTGSGPSITTGTLNITGATSVYAIVTGYSINAAIACTVTDNNSHTFTAVPQSPGSAVTPGVGIFYYRGLTGGAGYTWTANCGAGSYPSIGVMAFSGAGTTGAEDQRSFALATSNSIAAGTITTSATSLVLTAMDWETNTSLSATVPTGYTIPTASGDGVYFLGVAGQAMGLAFAYKVQSGAGAENPAWTLSGSDTAAAMNASFH